MKLPPLMAEEINKALKMCFEKKKKGMKSFEVVYFVVVKSVLLIRHNRSLAGLRNLTQRASKVHDWRMNYSNLHK